MPPKLPKHVVLDDIKWVIMPAKVILDSLNLWPERQNRLTHFLNSIAFLCMLNVVIGEHFYLYYNRSQLEVVATIIAMLGITIQAMITQALLLVQKDKLIRILKTIYFQYWPATAAHKELRGEMKRTSKSLVIYCLFYTVIMILCLVQYVAFSMTTFTGNLMFLWIYPHLVWKSPWYEIFHVQESIVCFVISLINCGYDFLFMSLLWNCLCQFKILGHVFRTSFDRNGPNSTLFLKKRLKQCVAYHNRLHKTCQEIEEVFTYYFLAYVVSTVLAICNASFILIYNPQELGKMLTYLSARVCSLLLYCFVGSELIYESSALSDVIYQSDWHLIKDTNMQKSLILMMLKSQKGEKLTAGGFVVLCLPSFLKIVQLAFSFYTALQSLMQK